MGFGGKNNIGQIMHDNIYMYMNKIQCMFQLKPPVPKHTMSDMGYNVEEEEEVTMMKRKKKKTTWFLRRE